MAAAGGNRVPLFLKLGHNQNRNEVYTAEVISEIFIPLPLFVQIQEFFISFLLYTIVFHKYPIACPRDHRTVLHSCFGMSVQYFVPENGIISITYAKK